MTRRADIWQRPEPCPFCEQGSALSLYACPGCTRLSIIFEEAGCVLPDPFDIAKGLPSAYFEAGAKCPHCRTIPIQELAPATMAEIEAAGVSRLTLTLSTR